MYNFLKKVAALGHVWTCLPNERGPNLLQDISLGRCGHNSQENWPFGS